MPDDGSPPRFTDRIKIRTMPNQKTGTETPIALIRAMTKSGSVPRRSAANTPIGMPTSVETSSALTASSSVLGSRWPMRWATGSLLDNEMPKSPRTAPPSHCA